jgi:alkylhydroperoxidase/carboxymuconolactone decarboxylase family protein YurZ
MSKGLRGTHTRSVHEDDDQLDVYVRRGLESGLTRSQITEALTHLGFYAGWPKATRAMSAVTRSFGKEQSATG